MYAAVCIVSPRALNKPFAHLLCAQLEKIVSANPVSVSRSPASSSTTMPIPSYLRRVVSGQPPRRGAQRWGTAALDTAAGTAAGTAVLDARADDSWGDHQLKLRVLEDFELPQHLLAIAPAIESTATGQQQRDG